MANKGKMNNQDKERQMKEARKEALDAVWKFKNLLSGTDARKVADAWNLLVSTQSGKPEH